MRRFSLCVRRFACIVDWAESNAAIRSGCVWTDDGTAGIKAIFEVEDGCRVQREFMAYALSQRMNGTIPLEDTTEDKKTHARVSWTPMSRFAFQNKYEYARAIRLRVLTVVRAQERTCRGMVLQTNRQRNPQRRLPTRARVRYSVGHGQRLVPDNPHLSVARSSVLAVCDTTEGAANVATHGQHAPNACPEWHVAVRAAARRRRRAIPLSAVELV